MSEKGEVGNGGDNEEGVREKMTEEVEVRRQVQVARQLGSPLKCLSQSQGEQKWVMGHKKTGEDY